MSNETLMDKIAWIVTQWDDGDLDDDEAAQAVLDLVKEYTSQ